MADDLSALTLLWCTFALFCGGVIKGALGVGTPLLTVPLMALVLPPQIAIAVMSLPSVSANLWQMLQAPKVDNVLARFWPTFVAVLLGGAIGVALFTRLDDTALLIFVGCAVMLFALLEGANRRLRIPPRREKPAGFCFGLVSGVIGGVSSFFGPMLIAYLVSMPAVRKEQFIGAISFLYLSGLVPWTIALYWVGALRGAVLWYSCAAVVPVLLGAACGRRLRRHIAEALFRRLILLILLLSGGAILWHALR